MNTVSLPQTKTGYAAIQQRYRALAEAARSGLPLEKPWQEYKNFVLSAPQPYHLRWIMRWLTTVSDGRPKSQTMIMEHGCGSASALLYMLAHGYTGIHGVDIHDGCEIWNRLLSEVFGVNERRFSIYDGYTLPFADGSFDFVFSEEVLEHVAPDVFTAYYDEGHRTLKPGGIAYYQVPHRLVPLESHLKAWFIHWLPRNIATTIYRKLGFNHAYFAKHVFLRWPTDHYRQLNRLYGKWSDITVGRLTENVDFEYYDGPRKLRVLLAAVMKLPLVGKLVAAGMAKFMMIQTVAWK